MSGETLGTDPRLEAVCAALAPYGWRLLTPEMVARRLLGALDRLLVLEMLGASPGGSVRELGAVEPVDRGDDRIEPIIAVMAAFRWRDATMTRVVQLLLAALDQWWLCRESLEQELTRILNGQS